MKKLVVDLFFINKSEKLPKLTTDYVQLLHGGYEFLAFVRAIPVLSHSHSHSHSHTYVSN